MNKWITLDHLINRGGGTVVGNLVMTSDEYDEDE